MKTKLITAVMCSVAFMTIKGQFLQNLGNLSANQSDAVLVRGSGTGLTSPNTNNRLGHLETGTYNNGNGCWSSLGRPIVSASGVTPNDQGLYGLTVNEDTDRAFFGTRRLHTWRVDGVIAWGDNDTNGGTAGSDRFVFEFHDANGGSGNPIIRKALTLMPNGANGVYAGIGTYGPTEQLHTTRGVRFAGVTTGGTPTHLVGIDGTGKLWRTPFPTPGGGPGLGNPCTGPVNPLTAPHEIPLGGFDFNFSGDSPFKEKVYVGLPCGTLLPAKFNVATAHPSDPSSPGDSYSIYGENTNSMSNVMNTGVMGRVNTLTNGAVNPVNKGVWGQVSGEGRSIGVHGEALSAGSMPNHGGYGGYFESMFSSGQNFGVYAEVPNTTSAQNYAVFGRCGGPGSTPTSGLGPDWAGYFDGDVFTTTNYGASDRRIKKNIVTLENSLEIIKKLNPVSYNFDADGNPGLSLTRVKQYGFISQEIEEILPELTKKAISPARFDKEGNEISPVKEILALNYNGFIAILAEGIKEQQKQIEELKSLVESLASGTARGNGIAGTSITLSDKNIIVLNQNVPNPFAESTTISYNIPMDFVQAQIIFSTSDNRVVKSVDITSKGPGQLNVFANDLTHGMYIYSLVVDGKTLDTKRMIKE